MFSALSKSRLRISTNKYFVSRQQQQRGRNRDRINVGDRQDRRGQGRAPDLQISCKCKKIDFKPTRPQTFSRCFQQFPIISSTSKFRFPKYYIHKIFQETSRIGRALCWKINKFINVITDCLSSRYCVILSKNNLKVCREKKFCRSLAACAAVLAAAIAALL